MPGVNISNGTIHSAGLSFNIPVKLCCENKISEAEHGNGN